MRNTNNTNYHLCVGRRVENIITQLNLPNTIDSFYHIYHMSASCSIATIGLSYVRQLVKHYTEPYVVGHTATL